MMMMLRRPKRTYNKEFATEKVGQLAPLITTLANQVSC